MALIRTGGTSDFKNDKFGTVSISYDNQVHGVPQILTPANNVATIAASGAAQTGIFLFNAKSVTLSVSSLAFSVRASNDGSTWETITITGTSPVDISAYKYVNILCGATSSQQTVTVTW